MLPRYVNADLVIEKGVLLPLPPQRSGEREPRSNGDFNGALFYGYDGVRKLRAGHAAFLTDI